MTRAPIPYSLNLSAGEWIEVRSKEEILTTLDSDGRLEGLPFMPQMFQYCGKRLRVAKRAHKFCDTVNSTGGRRMQNAVHLEGLRCDGQAFGGCEMACFLFWKEAWLKRPGAEPALPCAGPEQCTEAQVWAATRAHAPTPAPDDPVYVCQATQLPFASERLPMWNIGQYVEDVTSGNVGALQILSALFFVFYSAVAEAGIGFGWLLRSGYDFFQKLRGGGPYPARPGLLPKDSRTPSMKLNLQPGELVRIKSHRQLLETMDEDLRNRGMAFHQEMVPYCGATFRVLKRISKIINEKTGRMMHLKNECVVLEGADCVGRFTNPLACPRACYPYWREIWLERVENSSAAEKSRQTPSSPEASSSLAASS